MHQRVVALAGFHDDIAALAAVAARRAAARNIFLATKGHATVAAVAGFHPNFSFVDEHGWIETIKAPSRRRGSERRSTAGRGLRKRTARFANGRELFRDFHRLDHHE